MSHRVTPLLLAATCCALAAPATASAQLGGLAGGITGTAGGVVAGATGQVTGTLDQLLGGADALLPGDALGDVLVDVGLLPGAGGGGTTTTVLPGTAGAGADGARGATGTAGSAGAVVGGGGPVVLDARAPLATVDVVSRLSQVGRTGRLRLRVRSDEAGLVAFAAMIRPGLRRTGVKAKGRHDRSVIHLAPVMVAFRSAGSVPVAIRLPRDVQHRLGSSRNGRMSIAVLAADVQRNQTGERLKRMLRR